MTATVSPGLRQRLLAAILAALLILAAMAAPAGRGLLRGLELQTLDWRFRERGPLAPSAAMVLVMVDDRSAARLGGWPPPRDAIGAAVRRLSEAGVAVIGLNLLLTENRRPVPREVDAVLAEIRGTLPPPLRDRLDAALGDDPDLSLAVAASAADRVVVPYAVVGDARQANIAGVPPWIRRTAYRVRRGDLPDEAEAGGGFLVSTMQLAAAGASVGHVNLELERDGSLRTHRPALPFAGELYPSLPVELVRLYLKLPRAALVVDGGAGITLGDRFLPTDSDLRHIVNYYGPAGTVPTFPLADLLDGRVDAAALAGRIVLLGASAAGTGDWFATPFSGSLPGSEFLATAADNILTGRALVDSRPLDLAAVPALALLAAFLAGRRSPIVTVAVAAALALAWTALAQALFDQARLWLAMVAPLAAATLAAVTIEIARIVEERRLRQRIERQRGNLARYFPPLVVDHLAQSDAPARLDRTQEAAVMFVDIVGFTRLSEGLPPADAVALLRAFHTEVEGAVFAHGGMLDKFMGDGALACFGVPEPSPRAEADAILAGLDLLARLAGPAADSLLARRPLAIGIGLHAGPVLMGDIGGARQFQFTVVGDTVNVASRLEALTRAHDTALILSEVALRRARPHLDPAVLARFAPLAELPIRGREGRLAAWCLAGQPSPAGQMAGPVR